MEYEFFIIKREDKKSNKEIENQFNITINVYLNKIDKSINDFRFNVSIAFFYEVYNFFKGFIDENISNKILNENIVKVMKLMIPFTPHLAHECLDLHKCKDVDKWPEIQRNVSEEIKLAVQINGKTRDIVKIKKDLSEQEITKIISKDSKAKKYIENKKIIKTIFVKNKIINYILPNQ